MKLTRLVAAQINCVREAIHDTPNSANALPALCLGDAALAEDSNPARRVIGCLLKHSRIDNADKPFKSNRGLNNVRCRDHLCAAPRYITWKRRTCKLLLHICCFTCKDDWNHDQGVVIVLFVLEFPDYLIDVLRVVFVTILLRVQANNAFLTFQLVFECRAYVLALLLSGSEAEYISLRFHPLNDLLHELCRDLAWLRHSSLSRIRYGHRLFGYLVRRAIVDLEDLRAPESVPDDRVRRRGHHHELERLSECVPVLHEEREKHIEHDRTRVELVEDKPAGTDDRRILRDPPDQLYGRAEDNPRVCFCVFRHRDFLPRNLCL